MVRRGAITLLVTLLAALVSVPVSLAQQPKRGGVIRIAEREAPGLDPHLSQWPQYVSHPPYVKGFRHHDGYGLGMRLVYT
jgi:hypothetical protein